VRRGCGRPSWRGWFGAGSMMAAVGARDLTVRATGVCYVVPPPFGGCRQLFCSVCMGVWWGRCLGGIVSWTFLDGSVLGGQVLVRVGVIWETRSWQPLARGC